MSLEKPYKRINRVITLEEKLAILRELESGASRRDIEEIFKCSQSTISRVLLSRETLLQMSDGDIECNGIRIPSNREIYEPLTAWAHALKESGKAITPDMVKRKAEDLSRENGHKFIYSAQWLYKWKTRKNIKLTKSQQDTECAVGEVGNKGILKGLLNKREEGEKGQEIKGKNVKTNVQSDMILKRYDGKNLKDGSLYSSIDKPRTKRKYIRRLPAFMKTERGSQYPGTIYRSKKEKTFLTLLQKLEILQRLKNGERRPDLIIEYKLSQSAMSQIVSDEHKIQKLAEEGQNLQMKRVRGGIFKDGEAELNSWVQKKMQIGETLTRTQIKNKAKEIADRLHIDFKASTGWLEKWKARMNLDFNEKQILLRKIPSYIASESDCKNDRKQKHHTEITNKFNDNNLVFSDIVKQEILKDYDDDDDYGEEQQEDYSYDDSMATDIKEECLTPQAFYTQTLKKDQQKEPSEEEIHDEEPEDIKPLISTHPPLRHVPEYSYQEETLHEQVLNWLNRYKVSSVASTDLLNILQPHLNSIVKSTNTSTPLPKKRRCT